MRLASVSLLILSVLLTRPAFAQTTRPADDVANENAELKKRIDKLEAYVAELEAKLHAARAATTPIPTQPRAVPRIPAPYGYELPSPPFRLPPPPPRVPDLKPTPVPPSNLVPPLPRQSAPEQWKRHEFNGMEYYVVPLK